MGFNSGFKGLSVKDMSLMEMLYWQEILQEVEHQIITWGQVQTEW